MQKQSNLQKDTNTNLQRDKQIKIAVISILAAVILYVVSLFLPLISPFTKYPVYLIKCGGQPIAASNFASGNTYTVPGENNYDVGAFTNYYFCSEAEAHDAGFRKR